MKGSVRRDSSTSTPRPGWSRTVTLPGSTFGWVGKTVGSYLPGASPGDSLISSHEKLGMAIAMWDVAATQIGPRGLWGIRSI